MRVFLLAVALLMACAKSITPAPLPHLSPQLQFTPQGRYTRGMCMTVRYPADSVPCWTVPGEPHRFPKPFIT